MRIRFLILPASLAITLVFLAGCREDQADVEGLSRYTPEILIEETLSRYKAAVKAAKSGGDEAKAAAKSGKAGKPGGTKSKGDDDKEAAAVAKYGDEVRSRDAPGTTKGASVTALFDGVVKKVKLIEGTLPDQVYAKLDEAVDYDPELTGEEKDAFKDGMVEARKKAE